MSLLTTRPAPDSELLHDVEDGIVRVTFNRPQARNALTFAMYEGLAALCEAVDADRDIRAMIITGAGEKAFAAGTDITQFRSFKTPEDGIAYETRIERILDRIERCRVPTIAAIAGACTGGGAAIAAVCDMRIASADTRVGFPIARTLGNCLSIANLARLSGLIGAARTKEMIFTARLLDAAEAKEAGFLNQVLPDQAAMRTRVDELARLLASHAPLTLSATKEALRRLQTSGPDDHDLVVSCYMSADFREGMEAFLAKRQPHWTGR
jgi:enoyl-CoA hydratase/carnithine racemase